VRGRIGSPYFESVLTCPLTGTIAARVPYKGEIQVSPERFVFQMTSKIGPQTAIRIVCLNRTKPRQNRERRMSGEFYKPDRHDLS
jgi:hypothetical protein